MEFYSSKEEVFVKHSYLKDQSSSSSVASNIELRQELESIEETFLGNKVSDFQPSKVGEIRILCYYNGKPLITLGPHCKYYQLILDFMSLFLLVFSSVFQLILSLLVFPKANSFILTYIGYSVFTVFLFSFLKTVLTNPGIPERNYILTQEIKSKLRNSLTDNTLLTCHTCGLCVNSTTKIGHCLSCKICIIGYDHHCGWSSKCIGNGNIVEFRIFVYSGLIFFVYGIFLAIYIPLKAS